MAMADGGGDDAVAAVAIVDVPLRTTKAKAANKNRHTV